MWLLLDAQACSCYPEWHLEEAILIAAIAGLALPLGYVCALVAANLRWWCRRFGEPIDQMNSAVLGILKLEKSDNPELAAIRVDHWLHSHGANESAVPSEVSAGSVKRFVERGCCIGLRDRSHAGNDHCHVDQQCSRADQSRTCRHRTRCLVGTSRSRVVAPQGIQACHTNDQLLPTGDGHDFQNASAYGWQAAKEASISLFGPVLGTPSDIAPLISCLSAALRRGASGAN